MNPWTGDSSARANRRASSFAPTTSVLKASLPSLFSVHIHHLHKRLAISSKSSANNNMDTSHVRDGDCSHQKVPTMIRTMPMPEAPMIRLNSSGADRR